MPDPMLVKTNDDPTAGAAASGATVMYCDAEWESVSVVGVLGATALAKLLMRPL